MRGWKVSTEPSGDKWRCRWRGKHGTGQQTFLYKIDADELTEKKERAFQRSDAGLPAIREKAAVVRISEWAHKYLAEKEKNPRKNTYTNFDKPALGDFKEWALLTIGDTDVESLTQPDIYDWKEWLYREKEYSNTTVRMRLAHLKPALTWARKRGWVTHNVAWEVEMPKSEAPGRCLTKEEVAIALSIPPPMPRLAFGLLFNSGMRRGEALSLRKNQIEANPDSWRVHFEGHQTKNGQPKSVVLNPAAKVIIEDALKLSNGDMLFEGLTKDKLDYWADKISEKIGPFTPHDTKHTFCTHWMRSTGDLYGLKQMTGNSDQSLKVYKHLALGTPRGIDKFSGFAPAGPLNAASPLTVDKQKT